MRLIDADTLDDYLGKWADDFYENPENSDADFMDGYCMTMNRIYSGAVPTVDAIPVNWLTNLAKEYEESDNQFFRMDSCVIEDLIKRWKAEQEKQNGID